MHPKGGSSLRRAALGSGMAAAVWLTLALEACGGSSSDSPGGGGTVSGTGGKASGGDQAGVGGRATGGAGIGGQSTGGAAIGGGGGAGPDGPRVIALEHQTSVWIVKLDNTEGLYTLTCSGNQPSLVEQDPPAMATSLPWYGEYFVDGAYVNIPPNLGCDFLSCQPYPPQVGISDVGYVSAGTLPHAGGAGGAGGELPAYETYAIDGPFVFTNRYFTDSSCMDLVTEKPVVLYPAVDL